MDWKDALNALKDSGSIPEAPETDSTPESSESGSIPGTKGLQKTPLHIVMEKKGRGGKTATIIEGFEGSDVELQALAKTLKQKLGTGGSARCGEILIQGDRRNDIKSLLQSLGYKTKG